MFMLFTGEQILGIARVDSISITIDPSLINPRIHFRFLERNGLVSQQNEKKKMKKKLLNARTIFIMPVL